MRRLACLCLVLLSGCAAPTDRRSAAVGDLPPISEHYRERITNWATSFYQDRSFLADARISDPLPYRDSNGRLLWLVCLDARVAGGGEPSRRQIQAFGFASAYMSSPLRRNGATLSRDDCLSQPLTWRPWSEPARSRPRGRTARHGATEFRGTR